MPGCRTDTLADSEAEQIVTTWAGTSVSRRPRHGGRLSLKAAAKRVAVSKKVTEAFVAIRPFSLWDGPIDATPDLRFLNRALLGFVAICLVITFGIMLGMQFLTRHFWAECQPGVPCKWAKSQEEIYADVISSRVPPLKAYATGHDFSYIGAGKAAGLYKPQRDCVRPFVDGFKMRVGNLSSQPALVHEIYGYLRLENSSAARAIVADLWEGSLDLEKMLEQITMCARQNRPLHETLCAWLDDPSMAAELVEPPADANNAGGLRFAMHEVLVLERFAQEARKSHAFRSLIASHYASLDDEVEAGIVRSTRSIGLSEDMVEFGIEKWRSIFTPASNALVADENMVRRLQKKLMVNILEATDVDRSVGVVENADIGIALAASSASAVPRLDTEQNVVMSFSKEWLDAYNAWNLNYVTNYKTLHLIPKLLVPSVLCTADVDVRDDWLSSRSITLKSSFLPNSFQSAERRLDMDGVVSFPHDRRRAAAAVAARHLELHAPAGCCGFGSLYELWSTLYKYPLELSVGSQTLRPDSFAMYFLFVAWISVVLAGLGSEVVLGRLISEKLATMTNGYVAWHFAQLVFSMLLTVAFTSNDGIGLFFLPIGLWKMGFPETLTALAHFYHARPKLAPEPIAELINGIGTLLHHLSTSLIITGLCLHIFPRHRALVAGCIVPILQHVFVLLKYNYRPLFILVQLALELWFQIEVIANLAEFDSGLGLTITNLGRGLALSMLLAHYMYLTEAAIHLICDFVEAASVAMPRKEEAQSEETSAAAVSPARVSVRRTSTVDRFARLSRAGTHGDGLAGMEASRASRASRASAVERSASNQV